MRGKGGFVRDETESHFWWGKRRMLAERLDRSQRSEASPSTDDIKLRGSFVSAGKR